MKFLSDVLIIVRITLAMLIAIAVAFLGFLVGPILIYEGSVVYGVILFFVDLIIYSVCIKVCTI